MYKRTTRTAVSSMLAVPLTVGLAGPAPATPPELRTEVGARTVVNGLIHGPVEGRAGNVHELALAVHDVDGPHATGYLDSYTCPSGVESPFDPSCELTGMTTIEDGEWVSTQAKDFSSATVVGSLDLLEWVCDDETGCTREPAGSLAVDLTLTAVGDAVRAHDTWVLHYPGARFVNVLGRHTQETHVSGTIGGAELTMAYAFTETFSFRAVERIW